MQNAEDIRKIAQDLKEALMAIEDSGKKVEARFRRLEIAGFAALGLSTASLVLSLVLYLR